MVTYTKRPGFDREAAVTTVDGSLTVSDDLTVSGDITVTGTSDFTTNVAINHVSNGDITYLGVSALQPNENDRSLGLYGGGTGGAAGRVLLYGNADATYPGEVRITAPGAGGVTITGDVTIADDLLIPTPQTPASASAAGTTGTIAWDSNYLYICIATNTWQRVAHATW